MFQHWKLALISVRDASLPDELEADQSAQDFYLSCISLSGMYKFDITCVL